VKLVLLGLYRNRVPSKQCVKKSAVLPADFDNCNANAFDPCQTGVGWSYNLGLEPRCNGALALPSVSHAQHLQGVTFKRH